MSFYLGASVNSLQGGGAGTEGRCGQSGSGEDHRGRWLSSGRCWKLSDENRAPGQVRGLPQRSDGECL